jgi:hypothetical protein
MQKRTLMMVVAGGLMLAACGGGEGGDVAISSPASLGAPVGAAAVAESTSTTTTPTTPTAGTGGTGSTPPSTVGRVNQPPTISGVPATVVGAGVDYVFQPVVTDPDGDALRFVAINLPAWATLDPATGRIQGQPKSGDNGVSGPITLSVTDGATQAALPEFRIQVQPGQGNGLIKLAWQLPAQNTDGSAVNQALGTRVHYGRRTRAYDTAVTVPGRGTTRHVVTGLDAGTWYVALTTVDPEGLESDYSEERVALVN